MKFETFVQLTVGLVEAIEAALPKTGLCCKFGHSNQSCSAYLDVTFSDEDDDIFGGFKLRVSDHDDRYGSDFTIRIDQNSGIKVETIETEIEVTDSFDDEPFTTIDTEEVVVVDAGVFQELVDAGVTAILAARAKQEQEI